MSQPTAGEQDRERAVTSFNDFIQKGGKFEPKKGRYHLYVSYACPWATRTLLTCKLKGLEDIVPVTIVSPRVGHGEGRWPFATADPYPKAEADPIHNAKYLSELYYRACPNYQGRITVPVLWDKETDTIVNNESAEIIRIFNSAFDEFLPDEYKNVDLYPESLRQEIDSINEWVQPTFNSGVYRAGLASSQEVYNEAVKGVFESLDKIEKILEGKDYLVGDRLTEADVRLWVTSIRFDVVYTGSFKCNLGTIRHNYPNVNRHMKQLYWNNDAFKSSTDFDHMKALYYGNKGHNPSGIIPVGPLPPIEPRL